MKEKAWEKAEKQRVIEEEERERKTMEYFQQLQDKVLEEEAEESQIMGSKHKDIAARDKKGQWPTKKARGKQLGKHHRGAIVKMGGANPCERYVCTRQDCLVYLSR